MGFTALEGLAMGTRCGSIDPGVLIYLMDERGMDARALENLLYNESGLLGVSGISSDMRKLLDSDDPRAKLAVALYVYRIRRELGSLAAALGGLDALVFTAGIGENSAPIRERVCARRGLARSEARRRREPGRRAAHQRAGQPRVGLGDPDQRGADDRAPHATPPMMTATKKPTVRLASLRLEGFRDVGTLEIDFDPVTVIVGEHGATKAALVDFLDGCLGPRSSEHPRFVVTDLPESENGSRGAIRARLRFVETVAGGWREREPDLAAAAVRRRDGFSTLSFLIHAHARAGRRRVHPRRRGLEQASGPGGRRARVVADPRAQPRARRGGGSFRARGAAGRLVESGRLEAGGGGQAVSQAAGLGRTSFAARPGRRARAAAGRDAAGRDGRPFHGRRAAARGLRRLAAAPLEWTSSTTRSRTSSSAWCGPASWSRRSRRAGCTPDASPVVVVDSPDARLHPVLVARVWRFLHSVASQVIVTTNSADVVAASPLRSLRRLVRRDGGRVAVTRVVPAEFSIDDLRRVIYHVRLRRGSSLLARTWFLVEGETEVWLLTEFAAMLGYSFAAEGVACVEFAQCGLGAPAAPRRPARHRAGTCSRTATSPASPTPPRPEASSRAGARPRT